jgi:hypothetical protein
LKQGRRQRNANRASGGLFEAFLGRGRQVQNIEYEVHRKNNERDGK